MRTVPPLRLSHVLAAGTAMLLFGVVGLVAGFATRGAGEPDLPAPPTAVLAPAPEESLRTLAEPRQLRVGTAVDTNALANPRYHSILAREFNAVTAEDVMKWTTVEPAPGVYDRAAADQLVAFAEANNQEVYGHTLVWHRQVPAWVTEGEFSDPALQELLRTHIQDEVSHFRGKVWAWDVVNEPFDPDGSYRDSIWLRRLGPGYIADALRWARAADPDAKLFINDFGIEGVNPKSNALYDLVASLLAEDVPIDGVGFQVHWTLDPLPDSFVENLRRFAALGVDVAITELDARIPEPVTPDKLERQASVYAEATEACLAVDECVSLTVWGFTDAHSWVPRFYPGVGAAAMFDADFRPKPAYEAVAEALRRER
jgi:endo-1,4-beta-xylanase